MTQDNGGFGGHDPFEDPAWLDYARQAKENLVPMIRDSAVAVSIVSDKLDPKLAIETGYMILMDKPIILAVTPGSKIPSKLALVADEIVEVDLNDPSFSDRLREAIERAFSFGAPTPGEPAMEGVFKVERFVGPEEVETPQIPGGHNG